MSGIVPSMAILPISVMEEPAISVKAILLAPETNCVLLIYRLTLSISFASAPLIICSAAKEPETFPAPAVSWVFLQFLVASKVYG